MMSDDMEGDHNLIPLPHIQAVKRMKPQTQKYRMFSLFFFQSSKLPVTGPVHLNDRFCTVQAAAVNRPVPQWSSPVLAKTSTDPEDTTFPSESVRTFYNFLTGAALCTGKSRCAFGALPEFVVKSLLIPCEK